MRWIINHKAFSLLELVIVILIICALTVLALPQYNRFVETSKSMEALAQIGQVRRSIERCTITTYFRECGFDNLDIDNPNNNIGTHFTYEIAFAKKKDDGELSEVAPSLDAPPPETKATDAFLTIRAVRNTTNGGDPNNSISLKVYEDHYEKEGTGLFKDIK